MTRWHPAPTSERAVGALTDNTEINSNSGKNLIRLFCLADTNITVIAHICLCVHLQTCKKKKKDRNTSTHICRIVADRTADAEWDLSKQPFSLFFYSFLICQHVADLYHPISEVRIISEKRGTPQHPFFFPTPSLIRWRQQNNAAEACRRRESCSSQTLPYKDTETTISRWSR